MNTLPECTLARSAIHRCFVYVFVELSVSNDGGFRREGLSRTHAYFKMLSIARGANIVKKELGLQESYIPGEDERQALLAAPQ